MQILKNLIKKLIPSKLFKMIRPYYHGLLAWDAHWYYERPSEHLIMVGVTGTSGKSTTIAMLAHILNKCGKKCGYITTVEFFDGEKVYINEHGLSMPSEIKLQKQLRLMVNHKCKVAIVEATSEGLAQNRHLGINFDVALFTNLSRAHIEAHGSIANYTEAKLRLFKGLGRFSRKHFFPKKALGVNLDDPQAKIFTAFSADKKFGITFKNNLPDTGLLKIYQAHKLSEKEFALQGVNFLINLPGEFNLYNALLATACANILGVDLTACAAALQTFKTIAGRMEEISNALGIKIFVDYAPEPIGMLNALQAISLMPHKKIIHVFGSTGGHRDVAKRFEFGNISAQYADEIIITNDDVYGTDPQEIADDIKQGIEKEVKGQKSKVKSYEMILDRKQAIHRALHMAQAGDIVIITGKGSEQFLVLPKNIRIDWDDRRVVREELHKIELGIKN